jgi:hypothetical protein
VDVPGTWENEHFLYCKSLLPQSGLWRMSDSDFKRSEASQSAVNSCSDAFSGELFVRVVPELINSGGAFCGISIENTGKGYLTSEEWKMELQKLSLDSEAAANTVVIDVCMACQLFSPSIRIHCICRYETEMKLRWVTSKEPSIHSLQVSANSPHGFKSIPANSETRKFCCTVLAESDVKRLVPTFVSN